MLHCTCESEIPCQIMKGHSSTIWLAVLNTFLDTHYIHFRHYDFISNVDNEHGYVVPNFKMNILTVMYSGVLTMKKLIPLRLFSADDKFAKTSVALTIN